MRPQMRHFAVFPPTFDTDILSLPRNAFRFGVVDIGDFFGTYFLVIGQPAAELEG
jgi:hypothetical protein